MNKKPVETIMGVVVLAVATLFMVFAYRVSDLQIVKGYDANEDAVLCSSVIEALDVLMANESIKSDTITDMYLAYYPDQEGLYTPCWVAQTAENEIRIVKSKQD